MRDYVLEVCVDSVESAIAAWKGGATRLELCSDLIVGGTTPSAELLQMVKEEVPLPVHTLIRPRFGDFLYTDYEYALMCRQIHSLTEHGADAVVIGSLNADGTLNEKQMQGMMDAAGGKRITLHRAFDVTRDPVEAYHAAVRLGVRTILTSGQEKDCYSGRETLRKLFELNEESEEKESRPEILIGAGVHADVIAKLAGELPARSFHMSGKEVQESGMQYRNHRVSMGLPGISEFEIWRTSETEIRRAVTVLENL